MLLDDNLLVQLRSIFENLKGDYMLFSHVDSSEKRGEEMKAFLESFVSASPRLNVTFEERKESADFSISRDGKSLGITFKGVPGGHEFNTLLLAILNADGIGKNLPDKAVVQRIKQINGPIDLRTFVSLSCTNCPDVAQALNLVALNNEGCSHVVIDGGQFPEEAESAGVQAVPVVYADGEQLAVGRQTLTELVKKLEEKYGVSGEAVRNEDVHRSDVIVFGGGPAGASAAIYSVRKGLKVSVVASETGGSVNLTGGIENLITTQSTTGAALAAELQQNMEHYGVDLFTDRQIERVEVHGDVKSLEAADGERFEAPVMIVATGSKPRRLGVDGEEEYTGRGVAYCPHCDGPFFKGKDVVVVGGGNAGIEAAIDLAAICRSVTVVEFLDHPLADSILVDNMGKLDNVELHLSTQVVKIVGDGKKVTGIELRNLVNGQEWEKRIDGVFVQIGVIPGSELFAEKLERNLRGEIVTDREGRTSVDGIYAAGDVSDSPYKQIVTAIGGGATAALSAFNDRMRKG